MLQTKSSSQSNRPRSKIMMDIRAGKAPPEGFDQNMEVMVHRRLRRSSLLQLLARGSIRDFSSPEIRQRHEGPKPQQSQEEKEIWGEGKWRRWRKPKVYKAGDRRKERRRERKHRSKVLLMEQWKLPLW